MARTVTLPRPRSLEHLERLKGHRAAAAALMAARSAISPLSQQTALGRDALAVTADLDSFAPARSRSLYWSASRLKPFVRSRFEEIEDNRRYNPATVWFPRKARLQPRTVRSTPARWRAATLSYPAIRRRGVLTAGGVQFRAPANTIICIRRKRRRSAILAGGYGGGKHRRARQNFHSRIWC